MAARPSVVMFIWIPFESSGNFVAASFGVIFFSFRLVRETATKSGEETINCITVPSAPIDI